MDTDLLMIQKMKRGDDGAVEEFVRKYYPDLLRYCLIRIDDAGYAQDAVQETFERFFLNFGRYRHYGKAANYLYVIAGNICRDYYRGRREISAGDAEEVMNLGRGESDVRPAHHGPGEAGSLPANADAAYGPSEAGRREPPADVELGMDLRAAFNALPQELREAAILYFCQERKQTEIAKILGIGLPLVKYRIRKARELLKELLKEVY